MKVLRESGYGRSKLEWLYSRFHFSFAEYFNPTNMNFGVLRVLNDDLIDPQTGFDTHPHKDMEIITYIIDGKLTHQDSMGHKRELGRGHVQYMSAGTGIWHSEHNFGKDVLRLLQLWILPDKKGHAPQYGDYLFDWEMRNNKWLHMVSDIDGDAPIQINQDVNIYSLYLETDKTIEYAIEKGRQAYLIQIEGISEINGIQIKDRDALKLIEEKIQIHAEEDSHFLLVEMANA